MARYGSPQNNTVLSFVLPQALVDQLNDLANSGGFMSRSDCIRQVLVAGMAKVKVPDATPSRYAQPVDELARYRQRAEIAVEIGERREQKARARGARICQALGGAIEVDGEHEYCRYEMFSELGGGHIDRAEIREPLTDLREDAIELQYRDIDNATGPDVKARLKSLIKE